MKIEIEIESDQADFLIVECLKSDLENMQHDKQARLEGRGIAVFHLDADQDIAEMSKMIGAFKTVLEYYGEADES